MKKDKDNLENHKHIYHYTTLEGALGIIDSSSLWATQFEKLNDSSELQHAKKPLRPHLKKIITNECKKRKIEPYKPQEGAEDLMEKMYKALGNKIYICSFCGYYYERFEEYTRRNGLLSQWKGYANNGGIMVVFEREALNNALLHIQQNYSSPLISMDLAVYDDDSDKIKDLLAQIEPFMVDELFPCIFKEIEQPDEPRHDALTPFTKLISLYKHKSFHEENEVRIVIVRSIPAFFKKGNEHIIKNLIPKIHNKSNKGHPYVILPFKNAIKRIVVGPSSKNRASLETIKNKLHELKLDIPVELSDIPYIDTSK